jgi:ribosomal protein L29
MKKRDRDDINAATVAELGKKIVDLKKQISAEVMKRQTSEVKNVHTVKSLRQKLAVMLTIQQMKALSQERS